MAILSTTRGDFEVILEGPADGPLIVLLHGFPELNISWRHQIPALTTEGFRVLAPNQRGYDGSVRGGSYATADLARDVISMLDALGSERATIVGHDWGGGVAWTTARLFGDRVERLIALNCPPPEVLSHEVLTNPAQFAKSWYMFFFQIPRLPEFFVSRKMPWMIRGGSYNREAWNADNLAPYGQAFATPEDARGPVNWYRAAMRHPVRGGKPVSAPTLIIWGIEDSFLSMAMISPQSLRRALSYGNEADVVLIEGAGHFVQNEAPDKVTDAMLDWLAKR